MIQNRWCHRVLPLAVALLLVAAGSVHAGHISIAEFPATAVEFAINDLSEQADAKPADVSAGMFDYELFADPSQASGSVNLSAAGIMVASSTTAVVPEPGTYVLLGLGALGVLLAGRRRRKDSPSCAA